MTHLDLPLNLFLWGYKFRSEETFILILPERDSDSLLSLSLFGRGLLKAINDELCICIK